jgi:hypothetical protein
MTVRTLTEIELDRVKFEAMDNVLGFGAVPYASIRNVYGIIQDNVQSSSVDPTTSSTAVTAAGATTLTLVSAAGITQGTRVVLDVDDAREVVTVRNVSGLTISVVCAKPHAGTYPVEIESALTIVRGLLADLETLSQRERTLYSSAGVKSVDGERHRVDRPRGPRARQRRRRVRGVLMGDNATARDAFRALADACRAIPETFGTRSTGVTVRVRTYSGAVGAQGTTLSSTVDAVLSPRPRVRQVIEGTPSYFGGGIFTDSTGRVLAGEYEIGPITQEFPGGGYSPADLAPAAACPSA